VLEREEIYRRVWGYTMAHGERAIDVFIRRVRSKLRRASPHWSYIHTHFGVGYRFAAERNGDDRAEIGVAAAAAPESGGATAGRDARLDRVSLEGLNARAQAGGA
jgi:DNA-binding winged helix-turn-helix (wHTH) protein